MILYLLLGEVGIWYFCGIPAAVIVFLIASLVYWYYYNMAKREFGGITGDLAGYFLQICELALVAGLAVVSHLV
uniref:adenosylcobinamide-GDP ribazoletransferase n=1 Tax=Clostridium sp. 12(A) TaxID=1163671 RepID=UPI0004B7E68E